MPVNFYDNVIPVVESALNSLTAILKKAEAAPNSAGFITSKLHDDMLPLDFQVHFTTDLAQKVANRLTGKEPLSLERADLKTFADMYKRIDDIMALVKGADRATIEGFADKTVTIGMGKGKSADMTGSQYVIGYAFPNIFFHVTTAYAILRQQGVPLGKQDYLSPFLAPYTK
jgi:hypothetical protein